MNKFLTSSSLLCSIVALLSGCSTDIVVKSDVGEVHTVRKSAVYPIKFDKKRTISQLKAFTESFDFEKEYQDKLFNQKTLCKYTPNGQQSNACSNYKSSLNSFNSRKKKDLKRIEQAISEIERIKEMPDITLVKYRVIIENVNGDKVASDYRHLACIPQGSEEDRSEWLRTVNHYEAKRWELKDGFEDNLAKDGLVDNTLKNKTCEKYEYR